MRKKYVIFDFDGTLIDTNELVLNSWQAVYEHYRGVPGDPDVIYATFGEPLWTSMEALFPEVDTEEAIRIYRKYQMESWEKEIRIFPGLRELVEAIRASGRSASIVTSRMRATTLQYLDVFGIRGMFDVIITADDTTIHKPNPEPVLIALKRLGADAADAIMLGDTRFDIGCANNAGVESVLVTWSFPVSPEERARQGFTPCHVIDRPEELLELI